jgi:hypothetical protein
MAGMAVSAPEKNCGANYTPFAPSNNKIHILRIKFPSTCTVLQHFHPDDDADRLTADTNCTIMEKVCVTAEKVGVTADAERVTAGLDCTIMEKVCLTTDSDSLTTDTNDVTTGANCLTAGLKRVMSAAKRSATG